MAVEADSIGLLFPGQGAQSVGMGGWLVREFPIAKSLYDQASELLGYDLLRLSLEGPAERLDATEFSQPALFVCSMAAAAVFRAEYPDQTARVRGVAGLSLGEYSAICYAGGLDFESALRLVQRRGQAMQAAADRVDSGMVSVLGLDLAALEAICEAARGPDEVLVPANLLCPGNIAVSGHRAALSRLEPLAMEAGASKVIPLSVAGAFHTALMSPAAAELSHALESTRFSPLRLPIFSNVDAQPHSDAGDFRELLSRQLVGPVLWGQSLEAMIESGINGFFEIGTGRVLRGTLKRINRKLPVDGFGDGTDVRA